MCLLAHALIATSGVHASAARKELDKRRLLETREARRIQKARGCKWSEALHLVAEELGHVRHQED